ncbi:MAG: CRISPR-associated endonuclease Cas1 [Deltaproteobacteria bacterium]|nr:MAG: CRISPR-associated endonuclease Cas1 [Deltaproteobacteria bacterium]
MGILYVTEQGAFLTKAGERIVVRKGDKVLRWVKGNEVSQVIIFGNVGLTTQATAFLLRRGIDVVFLSAGGDYRGRLVTDLGKNVALRKKQFERFSDRDFGLALAREFVRGKVENCLALLRNHNRHHQDEEVASAAHRLRRNLLKVEGASSIEELMGVEGDSARVYFSGFGRCLRGEGFTFTKRTRRPPRDEVNAMLSFGYTLLSSVVSGAVAVTGLDPYFGSFHSEEYGRQSLVLDLMEEFRPVVVDAVVLRVVNRKIVTASDFVRNPESEWLSADDEAEGDGLGPDDFPVLMSYAGRKKFIQAFEARLREKLLYIRYGKRLRLRDIIQEQARLLARAVVGEEEYRSYRMG